MHVADGVTIGSKYVVLHRIGRGGMGSVWVARHLSLGNLVAIKFLNDGIASTPEQVARFEREARATANLDTPHIVRVNDYGFEEGTPYLIMELLRGEDLSKRLRTSGKLPLEECAKILSQMGKALRKAHEAGVVHRDLKPANVFLAQVDDEEVVKVLDFGIAKETSAPVEDATKTGEVLGSPHYMSPEQVRAEKTVDPRADLWATGVLVYRMATGQLPFPGEAMGEVMSKILMERPPSMAEVGPELPSGLDGFFARALAKRKEERFASAAELVEAFFNVIGAVQSARSQNPASGKSTLLMNSGATSSPQSSDRFGFAQGTPRSPSSGPQPPSHPPSAALPQSESSGPRPLVQVDASASRPHSPSTFRPDHAGPGASGNAQPSTPRDNKWVMPPRPTTLRSQGNESVTPSSTPNGQKTPADAEAPAITHAPNLDLTNRGPPTELIVTTGNGTTRILIAVGALLVLLLACVFGLLVRRELRGSNAPAANSDAPPTQAEPVGPKSGGSQVEVTPSSGAIPPTATAPAQASTPAIPTTGPDASSSALPGSTGSSPSTLPSSQPSAKKPRLDDFGGRK